jgi:hypothetical protein
MDGNWLKCNEGDLYDPQDAMPNRSIGVGTGGYRHSHPDSGCHSDLRGHPEAPLVSESGTRPVHRVTLITTCSICIGETDRCVFGIPEHEKCLEIFCEMIYTENSFMTMQFWAFIS